MVTLNVDVKKSANIYCHKIYNFYKHCRLIDGFSTTMPNMQLQQATSSMTIAVDWC